MFQPSRRVPEAALFSAAAIFGGLERVFGHLMFHMFHCILGHLQKPAQNSLSEGEKNPDGNSLETTRNSLSLGIHIYIYIFDYIILYDMYI
jgi:hypothetical protein